MGAGARASRSNAKDANEKALVVYHNQGLSAVFLLLTQGRSRPRP
jgi:hypothetical protein